MDIAAVLKSLSHRRPIFHSEADFQHALAWEIQTATKAEVRLEVPIPSPKGRAALDILVIDQQTRVGIELKYFKQGLAYDSGTEQFNLAGTIARDISRYDFCKDITRIEYLIGSELIDFGFAIALSNDPVFWSPGRKQNAVDLQFHIHHGKQVLGELGWSSNAGKGTMNKREDPHLLEGEYLLQWSPYSTLKIPRGGDFKVLVVQIDKGTQNITPRKPITPEPVAQPRQNQGRDRLRQYFKSCDQDSVEMTFAEVEALLGSLNPSAYIHRAWWSGVSSHPNAVWEHEGYRAKPDLAAKRVVFKK